MRGTVVAVLRGGPSSEHEVSLQTGAAALSGLPHERFHVRDIYIDRDGLWHERGVPTSPERVLPSVDTAVIALHGAYAHSGTLQNLLSRYGTPHTGANALSAYLSMHKVFSREKAREHGLLVPRYTLIARGEDALSRVHEANRSFMPPVLVAPAFGPASDGVYVHGFHPLLKAVEHYHHHGHDVVISEKIRGDDVFVGVVQDFRGEPLYTLPPMGLLPHTKLSRPLSMQVADAARKMHEALGLRHYSHSRFVISPKGIYYLSTSALPPLSPESPMERALRSVGVKVGEFFEHLADLARGVVRS